MGKIIVGNDSLVEDHLLSVEDHSEQPGQRSVPSWTQEARHHWITKEQQIYYWRDKDARALLLDECPTKAKSVDNSHYSISLFSLLRIDLLLNGWPAKYLHFLISENRTRWLVGLDIHPKFGLITTQVKQQTLKYSTNAAESSETTQIIDEDFKLLTKTYPKIKTENRTTKIFTKR